MQINIDYLPTEYIRKCEYFESLEEKLITKSFEWSPLERRNVGRPIRRCSEDFNWDRTGHWDELWKVMQLIKFPLFVTKMATVKMSSLYTNILNFKYTFSILKSHKYRQFISKHDSTSSSSMTLHKRMGSDSWTWVAIKDALCDHPTRPSTGNDWILL